MLVIWGCTQIIDLFNPSLSYWESFLKTGFISGVSSRCDFPAPSLFVEWINPEPRGCIHQEYQSRSSCPNCFRFYWLTGLRIPTIHGINSWPGFPEVYFRPRCLLNQSSKTCQFGSRSLKWILRSYFMLMGILSASALLQSASKINQVQLQRHLWLSET